MPAYTNDTGDSGGRRQWLVALVLLAAAVSVALLPDPRQQQVASVLRGSVLRPFVLMQEGLAVVRSRATDADVLRGQLDSLVAATSGHLALEAENRRLRQLVDLRARVGPGWVAANVVRAGTAGSESMFLLDVGSEHGVERYDPVISGQGVLGVIQEVHGRTSVAMDWTHPEFTLSAMDRQGIVSGFVRARRGDFREADRLEFDGTAFQAQLEDGTPVVTSGRSGVWPQGIPIGKVDGVAAADAGWRKSYFLRPMVDASSVTHAMVGVSPEGDLFGAWPPESTLTDAELAMVSVSREDSLAALGDSVRVLRALLAAPMPLRDSLLAVILAPGSDSLAALWMRAGGAADSAAEEAARGGGRSGARPGSAGGPPEPSGGGGGAGLPSVPDRDPPRPRPAAPVGGSPAGGVPAFPRPTDTIQIGPPGGAATPASPDTLGLVGGGAAAAIRPGTSVEGLPRAGTREGGERRR